MNTLDKQLETEKQTKKENLKNIMYVDYCNNCKDTEIRGTYGKTYTPCHHPWYCHYKEPAQTIESKIAQIKHNVQQRGYWYSHEAKEIKQLGAKKWRINKKNRKKWLMS